jgi:hypothetical protein
MKLKNLRSSSGSSAAQSNQSQAAKQTHRRQGTPVGHVQVTIQSSDQSFKPDQVQKPS